MKREEMAPTLQKALLSPQFCAEGWIQGMWALQGAVDSPPRPEQSSVAAVAATSARLPSKALELEKREAAPCTSLSWGLFPTF